MGTTLILIIIGIVTTGFVAYLVISHRRDLPAIEEEQRIIEEVKQNPNLECCGAHEVCEAETLLTLSEEVIYYNDEELDAYRGKEGDGYSEAETEEFREVLLTLQMHEVTGWLKSLNLRRITPPDSIREEALMIVEEFRQIRRENREKKTL